MNATEFKVNLKILCLMVSIFYISTKEFIQAILNQCQQITKELKKNDEYGFITIYQKLVIFQLYKSFVKAEQNSWFYVVS